SGPIISRRDGWSVLVENENRALGTGFRSAHGFGLQVLGHNKIRCSNQGIETILELVDAWRDSDAALSAAAQVGRYADLHSELPFIGATYRFSQRPQVRRLVRARKFRRSVSAVASTGPTANWASGPSRH